MKKSFPKNRIKKWSRRDIILFLERLELYISSGLSIDRSLHIIEEDALTSQKMSIRAMRLSVESGHSLADSICVSVRISNTVSGLIKHGESSGRLAQSLTTARLMIEHAEELKKKLTSAMAYPVIISLFALLLTLGLVRGVMPQIIPMLMSLHVQLPILTRIVIALSQGFISYGLYILIGLIILVILCTYLYRKFKKVRSVCHVFMLQVPLVSHLIINYEISVFLQSCGSLIETGSAAAFSYSQSSHTISLLPLRQLFESKTVSLETGSQFHTAFRDKRIPRFVPSLLSAGEISGTLGLSLIRAAAILDRDIDHSLKRLTSLVEPVMMAGMGLIVGSIALSIMMPIYDISKVLQK